MKIYWKTCLKSLWKSKFLQSMKHVSQPTNPIQPNPIRVGSGRFLQMFGWEFLNPTRSSYVEKNPNPCTPLIGCPITRERRWRSSHHPINYHYLATIDNPKEMLKPSPIGHWVPSPTKSANLCWQAQQRLFIQPINPKTPTQPNRRCFR